MIDIWIPMVLQRPPRRAALSMTTCGPGRTVGRKTVYGGGEMGYDEITPEVME